MDNERTNEFEREPEDTVTAAEQETAADETVGQPETAEGEEKTEAAPEPEAAEESEKISEEETEETAEVTDEVELCLACGERRRAEGSDYCAECEERMSSTKIPLLGWVAGFAASLQWVLPSLSARLRSRSIKVTWRPQRAAGTPHIPPTARSTTLFQA